MANPSQHGSGPDDDSWGKIASDLFGIQFNDADDFELPDDDAPAKPQPAPPVSSGPVAIQLTDEPHPAAEPENTVEDPEPAKTTVAGNEDHDEFWDILESWNWDENKKEASKPRRTEEPRAIRPRPDPAPSEARRPRREGSRQRIEDRIHVEHRHDAQQPIVRLKVHARDEAFPGQRERPLRVHDALGETGRSR